MKRERALQILLALFGLACLAGVYPLTGALRDGAASTINRQDQMILGIYIVLGVFLLRAVRTPRDHRNLILFAGWSTIAHDSVMIVQGVQYHDLRNDLVGFVIIALIGVALVALAPPRQASERELAQQPAGDLSTSRSLIPEAAARQRETNATAHAPTELP